MGELFGQFLFWLRLFDVLENPSGPTLRKSGGAEDRMKWGGAEEKKNGEVPKKNLRISLNIAAGGTGSLRHSSRMEHKRDFCSM
jgi:hypothetical protein